MSGLAEARMVWKSAGLHLVERQKNGWLAVTEDLLRAYLTRPEVHPVEDSCRAEHALFEKLMTDPRTPVAGGEIAAIADADAADNYRIVLAFRDHLLAHGSIEAAYAALFAADRPITLPPLFIEQMVHLIVAAMMQGEPDPFTVRASELFFREQKAMTGDGQLMLADAEIVEMYAETGGMGGLGALLAEAGTPMRDVTFDVLTADNASAYWDRADRFDMALDFRAGQPGNTGFARVIERWVRHFLKTDVRVEPLREVHEPDWSWHVGLDAEATRILNTLYAGAPVDDQTMLRIAGLFRLDFADRTDVVEQMRGKPVYLGLAMTAGNLIRMKPQNLLTNLPLKRRQ